MTTNIEISDDFIRQNYPPEFYGWLNQPYSGKTHGTITYYDDQVKNFIRSMFKFLSYGRVCFSAGTFVFNDIGQLLFNLLTYNKFLVKSNTYNCDKPLKSNIQTSIIRSYPRIASELVDYQKGHATHNKIFQLNKGVPIECIPNSKYTKFERHFEPRLEGLCETDRSESKRVLLYYPFKTINAERQLLFFKLERDPMVSFGHVSKAVATYVGNPLDKTFGSQLGVRETPENGIDINTGLDMRREDRTPQRNPNECNYDTYFREKDNQFYQNYYKILGLPLDEDIKNKNLENITELEWYNSNVRTGCEFYVTKNLLAFMIENLFLPTVGVTFRNIVSSGGKFTRKQIKYKKIHKKSKRRKTVKRQMLSKRRKISKKLVKNK
jgi:hypothetical protein